MTQAKLRRFAVAALACGSLSGANAGAEEFSTLSTSSVLGRNTGIPTGTAISFDPESVTDFEGHGFLGERGDPLYGLDRYAQLGGSLIFHPLPGLGIETGILGQWTDDELNFTYTVNFVWGEAFATPLRKTQRSATAGLATP